jgi:hypothetical protein
MGRQQAFIVAETAGHHCPRCHTPAVTTTVGLYELDGQPDGTLRADICDACGAHLHQDSDLEPF